MKTISCLSPLLCLLVLTACSGEPATDVTTTEEAGLAMSTGPDPVVARVDGTPLRRSDVIREAVSQGAIEEGGYLPVDDPVFVRITEELIDQRLLAIEARTRVYNEQASLSGRSDEVSARHILVNTREEIDAIKAELDAGADFAELAVLYSLDTATRMDGGDLGYFSRQSVLPEFSGVAFSTEVGQISDPFETPSGWHVLRVDSRRSAETPDLEEVRPGIVRFLTFEQIETLVRTLRDTIPVERIDLTASAPETADPSTDSDG